MKPNEHFFSICAQPLVTAGLAAALLAPAAAHAEDDHDPWHVLSGTVSRVELVSGGEVLRLHASTPPAEILRFLDEAEQFEDELTVGLSILPVADSSPSPFSSVNILGARMGFVAEEGSGRIYALDSDEPLATGFSFDILPNGEAAEWLELTVSFSSIRSHSEAPATWSLAVNGVSFETPLRADFATNEAVVVQLFGHDVNDVFLGGLKVIIDGVNLVLPEADGALAQQKDTADREESSFEDDPKEQEPVVLAGGSRTSEGNGFGLLSGGPQTIYVDGDEGSDSNDGLTSLTPKATIGAAVNAIADGGVVVVTPRTPAYVVGQISTGGKSITLRPTGPVVIK